MRHLPARCRRARTLLLGPLMPQDMDPASFVAAPPWWHRLLGLRRRQVGLMAQGLQRELDASGRVRALQEASLQLRQALGPATSVFLSDVETEVWANGTVAALAARTRRFLVTRGKEGADEHLGRSQAVRHPVAEVGSPVGSAASAAPARWPARAAGAAAPPCLSLMAAPLACLARAAQVDAVLDTNGAGDTFATAYMLAAAAGHASPISVAHWAGGVAVSQPQACKPACVTEALRADWRNMPASRGRGWLALPSPLRHLAQLLGLVAPRNKMIAS